MKGEIGHGAPPQAPIRDSRFFPRPGEVHGLFSSDQNSAREPKPTTSIEHLPDDFEGTEAPRGDAARAAAAPWFGG